MKKWKKVFHRIEVKKAHKMSYTPTYPRYPQESKKNLRTNVL